MSQKCISRRTDSIFREMEWECQRSAGHKGQHQRISKNFYPSKPDVVVNMVWDNVGFASTTKIPEPYWNECTICELLIDYTDDEDLCFTCNHWMRVIKDMEKRTNLYIINETLYSIAKVQGHGGRVFRVRKFGSDEIIETRNLWNGGKIPEHFQEDLCNNAEFVTSSNLGRIALEIERNGQYDDSKKQSFYDAF